MKKLFPALCLGILVAGMWVAAGVFAQTYQPIPNYSGSGAGFSFRQSVNDRFDGTIAIAPLVITLATQPDVVTANGATAVPDVNTVDLNVTGAAIINLPACATRHMLNLYFRQDATGHAITFSAAGGWSIRPASPPTVPSAASTITPYGFNCDPVSKLYIFVGYEPAE